MHTNTKNTLDRKGNTPKRHNRASIHISYEWRLLLYTLYSLFSLMHSQHKICCFKRFRDPGVLVRGGQCVEVCLWTRQWFSSCCDSSFPSLDPSDPLSLTTNNQSMLGSVTHTHTLESGYVDSLESGATSVTIWYPVTGKWRERFSRSFWLRTWCCDFGDARSDWFCGRQLPECTPLLCERECGIKYECRQI